MKKLLLGIVLVFATLFTNVVAEDNPRAVIIFDASGSMWGQINGVTKLEIARDALKNVVREWNPSVELGLTVYGHRSKGDCNDIETIIPVGKIDKNRVIKTVMGIKPKGKTPISRSLRKVAEEIKYTEEKATIILISDGKETCDPDPCGTAKELEAQGIDFVTHVIGFNVDKKTSKQLECIANATGGEYFSAKNATALNKAMKVIVKKVEVVVPPKPVVKTLKYNVKTTASETEGGKWVDAYHYMYKDDEGKRGDSVGSVNSTKKKAGYAKVPLGKYILQSKYNEFEIDTPFEVNAKEITNLHIVFNPTGKVEVTASEKEGGKWVKANCNAYKIIDGEVDTSDYWGIRGMSKKEAGSRQLPVGKYQLNCSYNEFKTQTPFELKTGEVTKLHIIMGSTGKVEVTASEKEDGKWVKASCNAYKIIDGEVDTSDYWSMRGMSKKQAGSRQLPVGKYQLNCSYNEFKKDTPFELKSGEVTKVHVVFEQFRIETKCTDMSTKVSYEVYANNGRMVYDTQKPCSEVVQLTLDGGDYTVEASIGNDKKEEKFTIGGGVSTLLIDMTTIKKEPTNQELIEADNQETPVVAEVKKEVVSDSIDKNDMEDAANALGELGKMFGQASGDSTKDLKEAGAFLEALGGLMDGQQTAEQKEANKQAKVKQEVDNAKADKEFDDMSKELDMYTK